MDGGGGFEYDYMADQDDFDNAMEAEIVDEFFAGGAAEYDLLTRATDTTAAEARRGKDIQGIPWDRLDVTRDGYRRTRLQQYKNYENVPLSSELVDKRCKEVEKGGNYYDFLYNSRLVKPTILHFQLRNLVWATSKHDVYFITNSSINHWSSATCTLSEVLNFSGRVTPSEKYPGSLLEGFSGIQISTLAIKENLLVTGGFQGEITCKLLNRRGVSFCTRTTFEDNSITNAIDIYKDSSGALRFMVSNNDCGVRDYDVERFQLLNHFQFPWPVNHTSLSPDGKLVVVMGDHRDALLADSRSGQVIHALKGHLDYSFASAWHPDGRTLATGNQDKTCRVWDVRNLSSAVSVLKGNLGAVRSIHYSSDGQFMVVAEPADFVHIYSTKADYKKQQELDFFGEISGVSLSPDDEALFVGICDRVYASLLQYSKGHSYTYLDSYV